MRKNNQMTDLPEAGEGKRGEQGYLGYLLRQAAGAYRHRMEKALADLPLTQPQFAVLTMLSAYPGHSNADLARIALLTPQTVSVIVANLEKAGLIMRRPHAIHGRIQHLDLTEAGRTLLSEARAHVQALEAELMSDLSPQETDIIKHWMVSVAIKP
jgi:DNA-binding MarR family transcriptional regulator